MWYHAIRSLFFPPEQATSTQVERRNDGNPIPNDGWGNWGGFGSVSSSGVTVSRETALSVPAIWAAVDTICKTLASLPFGIFQSTENGSKPAKSHPVYHLVRINPAPDFGLYNSYSFKYALFLQTCFGDAYVKIHRNGIGRPTNLELLEQDTVTAYQQDNGRIYYVVRRMIGNRYSEEVLYPRDVIHVKGLTVNGLIGQDVIQSQKDNIGTSIAAENFGNKWFANGAQPSGALVYPQPLTAQQRDAATMKTQGKFGGTQNAGKIIVLDGGVKFEQFSSDPQKSMLNETRNFQVNQSARIFGVPVPMLGQLDNATLNNMETLQTQFVNLTLRPYAVQVEQEFALKLLTESEWRGETYFFRFNFNGLLRGATKDRSQYYKDGLGGPSTGIGYLSVNEVRELENLDRIDDGDTVFTAEMLFAAQQQNTGDGTQEMEEPETDDENETNESENGTPQASNGNGE